MALIKLNLKLVEKRWVKKGIVRDKNVHIEVLKSIVEFCNVEGLTIIDLDFSPVTGSTGNIEF